MVKTLKTKFKKTPSLSASTQRRGHINRPERKGRRRTHKLKGAEEGTCEDNEGTRVHERHSPSGDGKGRDLSGKGKKKTEKGELTL